MENELQAALSAYDKAVADGIEAEKRLIRELEETRRTLLDRAEKAEADNRELRERNESLHVALEGMESAKRLLNEQVIENAELRARWDEKEREIKRSYDIINGQQEEINELRARLEVAYKECGRAQAEGERIGRIEAESEKERG